jgi:hypothetical protein
MCAESAHHRTKWPLPELKLCSMSPMLSPDAGKPLLNTLWWSNAVTQWQPKPCIATATLIVNDHLTGNEADQADNNIFSQAG